MPQAMIMPFMPRKMVDWNHGVKPRLYRRPNPSPRIIALAVPLLFELAKLTQA
jgi:hypothetical protein